MEFKRQQSIVFIDVEVEPRNESILDIGCYKEGGSFYHGNSLFAVSDFIKDASFVCGHNILNHDLKYLEKTLQDAGIDASNIIDTLFLSPLLFPTKPYHALLKDDKLQTDELNNPVNDAKKAKDLFFDEVSAFKQQDGLYQQILFQLLHDKREFQGFFRFIGFHAISDDLVQTIRKKFRNELCEHANLAKFVSEQPVALSYALALIFALVKDGPMKSVTPPWVLKNYPEVELVLRQLRNNPCQTGCDYCNTALDARIGLKKFFGFNAFRLYGGEPLQENAAKAALDNKSLLAIFPTGGGKSITFQVPALMAGENTRGLTVIISPLQSLMKDQVDNLEKAGITDAVTINGLLDPIERAKSIERVENGSACILYISPESLRSRTIEKLISGRNVVRFVVDEAHCFSAWGQDFRVDYLYIGDFIKALQTKKNLSDSIPVSCFTATAKPKVIEDIRAYFREKLDLNLELYTSKVARTNLHYTVFEKGTEEEKYQALRDLIEQKDCPTIVYVSRTKRAYDLAKRLTDDGFSAKPYHGKMDKQEKSENQDTFVRGETQIMVATSAFGMGVDKKDVGMVVHYEISDSLENYVQEAGRAGRDENIEANCYVLFNDEDLSKHFILLNQTKVSIKEIQQIWKAIKEITRFRSKVSNSALEIARKAGWDESVNEIETRVTTAIAALEDAGYLKRGQNMPRIFANSILSKNATEAIEKINRSTLFTDKQKEQATRIIKKLFSSKSKRTVTEESAESRVDYISDYLGIVKEEVIAVVNLLREEQILADTKDLTAFIKRTDNINRSQNQVELFSKLENFLLTKIDQQEKIFQIKELNQQAETAGLADVNPNRIKTVLNFWAIKNWIKRQNLQWSRNHFSATSLHPPDALKEKFAQRHALARFIVDYLFQRTTQLKPEEIEGKDDVLIEFSVQELRIAFEQSIFSFGKTVSAEEIEDTLFYLSRIEALKIEGGFLVVYNALTIERTEQNAKKQYTQEDYQKLNQFYESRVQQIHIVGEYARRMLSDYKDALQFVEDYFQLNYPSFLRKYFPGSKSDELKRKMTPGKFKQLFGELSPAQLRIINDNQSQHIVVAAGPGSGKTRVLVHKLASLLLMEDVKHEQLLMLTFSRAAATEFKKRLLKLIGNAAHYVDIKTFHGFCFDLLGRVGTLEGSTDVLKTTLEKIRNREVDATRITKTVLVIDEAQDMNEDEFQLVKTLMTLNEEMRVIAVGDDDQNIYEFRGANSKYLEQFIRENNAVKHALLENYRSRSNLVAYTNQFVTTIQHRLKDEPIIPVQTGTGGLKVIRYQHGNLITPLVQDVLNSELIGSTCILTKTNDEAVQITGLLLRNEVPAKLIQSNSSFSLFNLVEVRFFLGQLLTAEESAVISSEKWEEAKHTLKKTFSRSNKLEIAINLIRDFESVNHKTKYRSDFDAFIQESKAEDFFAVDGETVFVSTIHKAKGKEFDNVYLMLEHFNPSTDESKRALYVAMTRAKTNLTIHLNSSFLDSFVAKNLVRIDDNGMFSPPEELAMQLTHDQVNLGYFKFVQHRIEKLQSGDLLLIHPEGCANQNGELVLKFSKKFFDIIEKHRTLGFVLASAKVNFIVHWLAEGDDKEVKIVLPELVFEHSRVT